MNEEDEEFQRIEREAAMKKRKYDDDDIQDYVRPWVGLTHEEIEEVWEQVESCDFRDCVHPFARAIEAKLREKNT